MAKWLFSLLVILPFFAMAEDKDLNKELHYRLRFGSIEDMRLLLDHGASPDSVSEGGVPALTATLERTDNKALEAMKLLVAKGANVNAGGPAGRPPLIEAIKVGEFPIVKYLVEEAKADVNVRDGQRYDALTRAKEFNRTEIEKYLTDRIAAEKPLKPNTPEFFAQQTRLLAMGTCARQYYHFYYNSKQDEIPEAKQKEVLDRYTKQMRASATDLIQVFKINSVTLVDFQKKVSKAISDDLSGLISNRNRRANGVGKEGDMEKRCEKVTAPIKLKVSAPQ